MQASLTRNSFMGLPHIANQRFLRGSTHFAVQVLLPTEGKPNFFDQHSSYLTKDPRCPLLCRSSCQVPALEAAPPFPASTLLTWHSTHTAHCRAGLPAKCQLWIQPHLSLPALFLLGTAPTLPTALQVFPPSDSS